MSRAGRKRKANTTRQPNGRPRQPTPADIMAVARAAPHRRNVIDMTGYRPKEPDPRDPRLGSEFGRMRLRNLITAEQYGAGLRWARIVIRMRRAIAAPQETPRGMLGVLAGSTGSDKDMSPDEVAEAKADYNAAHDMLAEFGATLGHTGRRLPKLVWLTTGKDHACPDLPALRAALDLLVMHFDRLDKSPEMGHGRNAG